MRRPMANHSECDPEDDRTYADDLAGVDCEECITAYRRREVEWHADLAAAKRLRTGEHECIDVPDKQTETTAPGKGQK